MICIIKTQDGEITGWIIGADTHDLRRKAEGAGEHQLAAILYSMEFPPPGKHILTDKHTMLVD